MVQLNVQSSGSFDSLHTLDIMYSFPDFCFKCTICMFKFQPIALPTYTPRIRSYIWDFHPLSVEYERLRPNDNQARLSTSNETRTESSFHGEIDNVKKFEFENSRRIFSKCGIRSHSLLIIKSLMFRTQLRFEHYAGMIRASMKSSSHARTH